jgi:hypothetical protein
MTTTISSLPSPQVAKQVSGSVSWASPELFGAAVVEFISAQEKEVVDGVQRNFQQVTCRVRVLKHCAYMCDAGRGVVQRPPPQAAQD